MGRIARGFCVAALAWSGVATASDGVLDRANGNEPDTLDPQKYELLSENNILRDLFEGLTTQGPDNKIEPGQAESWTVSEDGLVWTFRLREGLKWSDGVALMADDFVAGMRRSADPATGAKMPEIIYKFENARAILAGKMTPDMLGVSAPDARTVVVRLAERSPLIPEIMSNNLCAPIPRHVIEKVGDAWVKPGNMVSNGAYTLAAWEPSTAVKIVRNPNYRDPGSVAIGEVMFYPADDLEMALKRFRAGEIDFLPQVPSVKIDWARKEMPDALQMTPVVQVRYLEINHMRAFMQDVRVRRALALAIDRETIAGRLMQDGAIPAYGLVPRAIEGYGGATFDFAGLPQAERVAEAKRLLAEAGYGPSTPLTIELRTLSDSWAKPVATAIGAMWQAAGVNVQIKTAEGKSHYNALDQGDFDIAMSGWFGTYDPETFMWLFQTGGGINESKYSNATFDTVSRDADQTMDMTARYARYADAEKILMDDVATVPLFWTIQPTLLSPEVKGFGATPRGVIRSRYASFGR
jgi:oligopeptide transport system substrate-binding protein